MVIVSVRQRPEWAQAAVAYFQRHWASEDSRMVYEDCITHCLRTDAPLPQWYLLVEGQKILGCVGLITNDFISRMDLWPWLCALYVEEDQRGKGYAGLLIKRVKADARALGFDRVYLCTDLVGFYERFGFEDIGVGYHPWGETSRIYRAEVSPSCQASGISR